MRAKLLFRPILALALGAVLNIGAQPVLLETGGGEPLLTYKLSLQVPANATFLEFEFGFASDEISAPGEFLDSVSFSLQGSTPAETALLLTGDVLGVNWAPENPGGLTLDPLEFEPLAVSFPLFGEEFQEKYAFTLRVPVPEPLQGSAGTFFMDLFDNQDAQDSLAYLAGLVFEVGEEPTVLESSASANGPFALEDEAVLDAGLGAFTVPLVESTRSYRIRSDSNVSITSTNLAGGRRIFGYEFPPPNVVLESASTVDGPYAEHPGATVDLENRTIRFARPESTIFFRLRGNLRMFISRQEIQGSDSLLHFEVRPTVFALQSAPTAAGPFADENGVMIDFAAQTISMPELPTSRFYRVRSGSAHRITSMSLQVQGLVITFVPAEQ